MANVNVIYHHFPHYRRPIIKELAANGFHNYRFWGSHQPIAGIEAFAGDQEVRIEPLSFKIYGRLWLLTGYWPAVWDPSVDLLIILANPNIISTWIITLVARLRGKKVLFWTHGWLKRETYLKRKLRNFYLGLANHILVYGCRAKEIGVSCGFSKKRISVIYNSLDFTKSTELSRRLSSGMRKSDARAIFADPLRPLIICTARLTAACRFDLLFEASKIIGDKGMPWNILLVGDGPERAHLERSAKALNISVHFFGACYDEDVVAELIYDADLTVSPGKIGLTVIHSLSYGTPAITHDNFDEQMPEVEAITPGVTGDLFRYNDAGDLAQTIQLWLSSGRNRQNVRRHCQEVVATVWNPVRQRVLIDQAVTNVLSGRAS